MKTWFQSAAVAAKITSLMCFGLAGIVALSHAAAWLAAEVGIVPTVLLVTFVVFAVLTVFVRIGSRVRAEGQAELMARQAAFDARQAEIESKIQYAQELARRAQHASQQRPDISVH